MVNLWQIIFFVFFMNIFSANGEGYLAVIGSKKLRTDVPYKISINSYNFEPTEMKIGVERGWSSETSAFKNILVSGTETKTIEVDVSNITGSESDTYNLIARTIEGFSFTKSAYLDLVLKKFSTFIQTDKSIYKPGDKVQFRAIILDSNSKPYQPKKAEIYITDSAQNKIKQFNDANIRNGVFQNELQLPDLAVFGDWTISVVVDDEKTTKTFEVAEYVLPKFDVKIETAPHVTLKEGKIRVTVRATYTYGKPVKGQAIITATHDDNVLSKMTIPVDLKGSTEFDLPSDLKVTETVSPKIQIDATFQEQLTGLKQNASAEVQVHKYNTKIEVVKLVKNLKPGLPYPFKIRVSYYDGSPVVDSHNKVNVTMRTSEATISDEYSLNENGMVEVSFDVPRNSQTATIKASYLETSTSKIIDAKKSDAKKYLVARIQSKVLMAGEKINVDVLASEEMSMLTYQVLGQNNLLISETFNVPEQESFSFSFTSSYKMLPKANLLVYYINSKGHLISDYVEIEFAKEFKNFLNIKTSKSTCEPGDNVTISIQSNPHSYVGLLGVDQSVLLLKQGNDIDANEVFDKLTNFKKSNNRKKRSSQFFPREPSYSLSRLDDKFPDFDSSDTAILTNAKGNENLIQLFPYTSFPGFGGFGGGFGGAYPSVFASATSFASSPMFGSPEPSIVGGSPSIANDVFDNSIEAIPIAVRTHFPETFIFDSIDDLGNEGISSLSKKVPDTITSWVITGFAINSEEGIGFTSKPTKINVFKSFFISTKLPYSVKRGETVEIQISAFNYLDTNLDAEITLFNELNEFEFVNMPESNKFSQNQIKEFVTIKANSGSTVSFKIKPIKIGQITIKALGISAMAGDQIEKELRVEPEGVTQYANEAFMVDLRETSEYNKNIQLFLPPNVIDDSTRVEFSVIGDLLGPALKNLDSLIKLPSGCGEQNMLKFVPNIVVLDYLTKINQLDPELEKKIKNYMEIGYQKELTYKHSDGSYSAFGTGKGSTWLTAFVAKSFNQAKKYITIDDDVIAEALTFLSSQQAENGSFPENGKILATQMQGGAGSNIGLTAYTLITFLENKEYADKYQDTITRAMKYILDNLDDINDTYSLAVANYALQLAKHNDKEKYLDQLEKKSTKENGEKYWKNVNVVKNVEKPWENRPSSINIELTAYALLAYTEAGRIGDAISIVKWLTAQRNENGGFQSTQDTVVGLQALAQIAGKVHAPNTHVELFIEYENDGKGRIEINQENEMVLQKLELPRTVRNMTIKAKGQGFMLAQIAYRYNIDNLDSSPRFTIHSENLKTLKNDLLELKVCTNFIPDAINTKSNMAVMEVAFPSGFSYDLDNMGDVMRNEKISKVETKNDDTVAIMYFDEIDQTEVCPTLTAFRKHVVSNPKPSSIQVYDYYDNSRRATSFYNLSD